MGHQKRIYLGEIRKRERKRKKRRSERNFWFFFLFKKKRNLDRPSEKLGVVNFFEGIILKDKQTIHNAVKQPRINML